jgi:hypothetical protein
LKSSTVIASLVAMIFAATASRQTLASHSLLDSAPQSKPVANGVSDGRRGSIAPGGTFKFKQLKIAVLAVSVDSSVATPRHITRIRLQEGGATAEMTARQGESLNWHGYHVAIAGVHGPGELGGERVELEVATIASLPQCVGKPIGKDSPWPCTTP